MWLQEIPFRHIWNGTQNGLHCSFSLEQVDRSETQLTCNILVAQSEMSANQQIIHVSRNVAQVPLSMQHFYSAPVRRAECCDERVCLYVCVFIFACPRSYLRNYTSDIRQFVYACYRWPWLGPTLAA